MLTIEEIRDKITPICQKYGVKSAYLFGSYARGEATEKSDVDIRIEQGDLSGLSFCSFYVDVEEALSCDVDILTTRQIPKNFLDHINKEEVILYGSKNFTAA